MYKHLKVFAIAALISFVCTGSTYGAEPTPSPTAAPEVPDEAVPALMEEQPLETAPTPAPDTVAEPAPEQPSEEQSAEFLQAASLFSKEVEAIVIKRIDSYYKNSGRGTIGIYIKELKSGYEYACNADKTNPDNPREGFFNTASTCKLLSAAVMYYMNFNGELELDKVYTDKVTKGTYNLRKLLPRMISHSVNDYFNITLRHLGAEQINGTLEKLGLRSSLVYSEIMPAQFSSVKSNISRYGISRSPRTTPRDLGCVLELLYCRKTFGEENDNLFRQSLLDNIYSNRLPAGVGYRSPVAHKTGTSSGEGVYNDAGIVYLEGNPYIMVVMSKGSGSSVQPLYRSITREVYDYMKKRTEVSPPFQNQP